MTMLYTAELNMAETIGPNNIADFLKRSAWVVCSTYHTILKAYSGALIIGQDMLFDILFFADQTF